MAFALSASWNSRSIIHLARYPSRSSPMISSNDLKMKAVGRIQIPGTLGYDLSFIRLIQTPTGRTIRFVTNRKIAFAEAYTDSQSQSFDLTAGEFQLNDQDKSKSTGVLYPACQLTINKDGDLQMELNQNAWRLSNIIDWKGTAQN